MRILHSVAQMGHLPSSAGRLDSQASGSKLRGAMPCVLCHPPADRVLVSNDHAIALWDGFPVTPLHVLVVPRRHVVDFFGLCETELLACNALLRAAREAVIRIDSAVCGFNVGANVGETGGQTVFHCHLHLIPRRVGDVENPRGGIRNVIPGKGPY